MWPAPMRNACGSTTYSCPARRTMTPHPGPAPGAALPTAGHRIAHGLAAISQGKTDLDNGILHSVILANGILGKGILDKEIPGNAVRATGTTSPHDVATTAPQRGRAISKDPTGRKPIVALGPMLTTAHPGDAVARLAKLADQADATADGVHNIPNCYSRGGSHVPTLHF